MSWIFLKTSKGKKIAPATKHIMSFYEEAAPDGSPRYILETDLFTHELDEESYRRLEVLREEQRVAFERRMEELKNERN